MKSFVAALAVIVVCGLLQTHAVAQNDLQVEAKLGRAVADRELTEEASAFKLGDRVYLWLKVTGGSDDPLTVTWKSGEHAFTSTLHVGGSPWRTWAYKTLAIPGEWTVTLTDAAGNSLKELRFTVGSAQ